MLQHRRRNVIETATFDTTSTFLGANTIRSAFIFLNVRIFSSIREPRHESDVFVPLPLTHYL